MLWLFDCYLCVCSVVLSWWEHLYGQEGCARVSDVDVKLDQDYWSDGISK